MSGVRYAASIEQLAKRLGQIMITSKAVAKAAPFLTFEITGGVLAPEALALFDKKLASSSRSIRWAFALGSISQRIAPARA